MGRSLPFAPGRVFRVIKSPRCWKTAPATCGWEWMTDSICSRMGASAAFPNPVTSRWGWWLDSPRTSDGNIWAECFGNPRKLVRIRDFQVREEFPESQVPGGRTLAADPQGGIWIGTLKGDLALFRHGVLKNIPAKRQGRSVYPPDYRKCRRLGACRFRRRAGRVAARQGAADDDEKRPALQLRDFLC